MLFRSDFYYRLCADQIRTPSLVEQLGAGDETLEELISFIARKLVGKEDADQLRDESLHWVQTKLGVDYDWPGNVRELEQCVRNILIRREYIPARRSRPSRMNALDDALSGVMLNAEVFLNRYITHVYFREGSFEGAGRILGMDRRTVKSKVDQEVLEQLQELKERS